MSAEESSGTGIFVEYLRNCAAEGKLDTDAVEALAERIDVDEIVQLEWVVDVADAQGLWNIGTAYSYSVEKRQLSVAIPDAVNPQWSGVIRVEPRGLRLLENVDATPTSKALFQALLLASEVPVNWVVAVEDETGTTSETSLDSVRRLNNTLLLKEGREIDPSVQTTTFLRFQGRPQRPALLLEMLESGLMQPARGKEALPQLLKDWAQLDSWQGPVELLRRNVLEALDFVEELRAEDQRTTSRTHDLIGRDFTTVLLRKEGEEVVTDGLKAMRHAERVRSTRNLREEQIAVDEEYSKEIHSAVSSALAKIKRVGAKHDIGA